MLKKILFICRYNRFRSKYAESLFKKINKNKDYKAKSAGAIKGFYPYYKNELKVGKELGLSITGRPQGLSSKLLDWADIYIIVADDVPASLFTDSIRYGKKLIIWKVPDANPSNKNEIKKIIKQINKRI